MKKKKVYFYRRIFLGVLAVVLAVLIYQKFFKSDVIRVVASIPDYSYQLESNQTKIFKKYYRDLEEELEDQHIDEENYAKLISKMFLIDFYTLSNKVTNQDVGGVQFLHSSIQENFKNKATDTLYKYVQSNIYGNRRQQLPTVKDVSIEKVSNTSYSYQDVKDDSAYQIDAKIIYKKDLGYDKKKTLVLVHEDMKLSIVEVQ